MSENHELKRVLGFKDLMAAAIGQIIGAGIMSLTGAAIGLTGKSTPLAFILSTIFVICNALPYIFINSTIRLTGGAYTIVSLFVSKKLGGFYSIVQLLSNLSLAMYALSAADYFMGLFNIGNRMVIAIIILTLFYVLNLRGIDKFAAVQNVIVVALVIALIVFTVFGLPKVDWGNLFNEDEFMTGGLYGLMRASTLLTFATGGATIIVGLAGEAKNPTRDMPKVIIISTLCVAVLYAVMSIVACGVLPLDQTANQSLVNTAKTILPAPLFIFFILCGAEFALASTLNSQFASATKPLLQATWDGWFPESWGKLSKWKTPTLYLTMLYIVGLVTILTGFDIDKIGSMCLILSQIMTFLIAFAMLRLETVTPEAWAESKFHVSHGTLIVCAILAFISCGINFVLQCSGQETWILVANAVMFVVSMAYSILRFNSGKVTQDVSYERS